MRGEYRIIGIEDQTVTLIVPPQGDVVSFEKASVVGLRAISIPVAPQGVQVQPPEPPGKPRYVGLGLGFAPSIAVDAEYKLFYGFANGSILVPLVSSGNAGIALSFGAGVNFPLTPGSRWHFEVYGHYSPLRTDKYTEQWVHALGVGVGVHYTARNGFTFGFKLPVIGASFYTTRSRTGSVGDAADSVGLYYLASGAGLPLAMIGYRF